MAKFRYRLQHILSLKGKLEEQAKVEYGEAKVQYEQAFEQLKQLEQKKVQYENQLRDDMSRTLVITTIINLQNAIHNLEEMIKKQMLVVRKLELAMEQKRENMNQAMVERKTQEKLKENALDAFCKEMIAVESKEVDELVSYKYNNSSEDE